MSQLVCQLRHRDLKGIAAANAPRYLEADQYRRQIRECIARIMPKITDRQWQEHGKRRRIDRFAGSEQMIYSFGRIRDDDIHVIQRSMTHFSILVNRSGRIYIERSVYQMFEPSTVYNLKAPEVRCVLPYIAQHLKKVLKEFESSVHA